VLPINLFNEKIYIFIWFWFVFVALANFTNLLTWVLRVTLSMDQSRYVKHHLRAMDKLKTEKKEERRIATKFVNDYLRKDGVLVLRMIGINANELVVAELAAELFNIFELGRSMKRNRNRYGNGNQSSDEMV
jgi:hypothetical protein